MSGKGEIVGIINSEIVMRKTKIIACKCENYKNLNCKVASNVRVFLAHFFKQMVSHT